MPNTTFLRSSRIVSSSLTILVALTLAAPSLAHDIRLPIAADELSVLASGPGEFPRYEFHFTMQEPILLNHDPQVEPTAVLVYSTGPFGGSTGLLELDPSLWSGNSTDGYLYSDPGGTTGISSAILERGELHVVGDTLNWPFAPAGTADELWFHFLIEDEWLCAVGDPATATELANRVNRIQFTDTTAPFSCPDQVCGNKIREPGEVCDDGNLIEDDGCSNDCQSDACDAPEFDSTYEGIQSIIFDGVYDCTNDLCHSPALIPAQGALDLTAGASYDQLVNVPSTIPSNGPDGPIFYDRVEPSEFIASYLYEKLAAKTFPLTHSTTGTPMPSTGTALIPQHLEAIEKWIRVGAPEDLVVEGTAGLLGTCLPPEDPLKIEPPPLPPTGEAIQFRSTAWPLPANFEDEICYATYYDFTQTNLVPEEDQLDCPGYLSTANNPSGKCFYYNRRILRQDAQSHHSIIDVYNGDADFFDPASKFGPFTYKPNYPLEPGAPQGPCDPSVIDPNTGMHNECSGGVVSGVTCTGYGPDPPEDVGTNSVGFAGSQEPFIDNKYYDGVYSVLPMSGVIVWNSHAFNLTEADSTMGHYLDIAFGEPDERLYPARGIFDVSKIFVQQVPPFETREYCKTFTIGSNQNFLDEVQVFELSSHTHRWGTKFRIWGPPQEPCQPGGLLNFSCEPNCACGPGEPEDLLYFSTEYTDPVLLEPDPPMLLGTSIQDRTFLYCSEYDNGSTPQSPPVKRQSTSPSSPPFDAGGGLMLDIGGPCPDVTTLYPSSGQFAGAFGTRAGVTCIDGPRQGDPCGLQPDPATFCETGPGFADGECDACEVFGGFTTEDEMFILLGTYFIPEPSAAALAAAALATTAALARRRRRQS
jgi:cysteine-rich repeat protein